MLHTVKPFSNIYCASPDVIGQIERSDIYEPIAAYLGDTIAPHYLIVTVTSAAIMAIIMFFYS